LLTNDIQLLILLGRCKELSPSSLELDVEEYLSIKERESGAEIAGISASLCSIGYQQRIGSKRMVGRDLIDPRSYWVDSIGCIRRGGKEGGKQAVIAVILRATKDCSDAERKWIYQTVRDGLALKRKVKVARP
jgi:hypothetical protein